MSDIDESKFGTSEVTLTDSLHNPWAELEVVKMIGYQYIVCTNTLKANECLRSAKIDPMAYIPYSYNKWN